MDVEDGSNRPQGPSPTAHLANASTEPVSANMRVKTESAQDPHETPAQRSEDRLQEHAPRQQEERQYAAPDDLDEVTGLTPEQIIRIYSARPPMLFTALHKEPTSTGIAALTAAPAAGTTAGTATAGEINPGAVELESFLGCKLAALPSSTPNMHKETLSFETWTTADKYLDLVEAMWAAQALKERHFDSWIMDMRNMHIEQVDYCFPSFPSVLDVIAAGIFYFQHILPCADFIFIFISLCRKRLCAIHMPTSTALLPMRN